jgi:serine protease Do
MDDEKTHYEVLGLRPDAKHTEIGIAYQRIMGKRRSETAPPDPRGDARLREAYETLSDLESRAYYDAELQQREANRPLPKWRIAGGVVALLAVVGIVWWLLRPDPSVQAAAEAPARIMQVVAPSVGRIDRLQVSGKAVDPGIAFAIEEGVLVTSCHRMAPGTQLLVTMLGRKIPATVRTHDEKTGLCQLSAPNTGSWPLLFTAIVPRPGDRVYAARVGAKGEVAIAEGEVKRVVDGPSGRVLETTLPMGNDGAGSPLFDAQARVAAVATFTPEGRAVHVLPPEEWRGPMTDRSAAGKAADEAAKRAAQEALEEAQKPKPVDDLGMPAGRKTAPGNVSPEREKALEKAFRPPPTVPDDL